MIEFENVSKFYANSSKYAVRNLNLDIEPETLNVILGESGSGKTTTLKMVNRLTDSSSGSIKLNREDIRGLDPIELRRRIGYAFQGIGLFPHFSVGQNIAVVPRLLGWPDRDISARVEQLLEMVGMPAIQYRQRYPHELSGGQQQRVGVARALAGKPRVLLMDEPFGALDPITRDELQVELKSLQQRLGLTVLLVTHDVNEALLLADRIGVMKDGELLCYDTPQRLVGAPPDAYVRELMEMPKRQAARLADLSGAGPSGIGGNSDD
jgi:osmoprotectant transport system ATP-binding protein